jgi:hypothetical protein
MRHILLFLVMWLSSMCYGIQFSIHTVFVTESFFYVSICVLAYQILQSIWNVTR